MTNYILIYDDCCFYEIVLLGYFMRYSNMGEQPCSYCMAVPAEDPHRDTIRTAEGFRVQADTYLEDIDPEEVTSFIIPGGDISRVRGEDLSAFLHSLDRTNPVSAPSVQASIFWRSTVFWKEKTAFGQARIWL